MIKLLSGDCRDVLPTLPADSLDACVTDPPYHLGEVPHVKRGGFGGERSDERKAARAGFMGKAWDGGDVAFQPDTWRAVLRVLKPGAHLLAFGGTRTAHRMTCAIEDAGFEIRDTLCWLYGSGFPKSLDVSKAMDKAAGAVREVVGERRKLQSYGANDIYGDGPDKGGVQVLTAPATDAARQWQGWGSALKPAHEPIILARKPFRGSVAANVLAHGTGALNVDACRVAGDKSQRGERLTALGRMNDDCWTPRATQAADTLGRWPANVVHDGSPEVEAAFAAFGERTSGVERGERGTGGIWTPSSGKPCGPQYGDTGSASRFFYAAKADSADRADSKHPTVKPIDLLRWLVRLITPPGGTVLDPFAGSGTTGEAAMLEGCDAILIEREAQHAADIRHRIARWSGLDAPLFTSFPPAEPPEDERMRDLFADAEYHQLPPRKLHVPAGWDTGPGAHGTIHRDGRTTRVAAD